MNNSVNIDLTGDNAINIGSRYSQNFKMFDSSRDLEDGYAGLCQVRASNESTDVILSPTITVLSSDIFQMLITPSAYATTLLSGTYQYDIRFSKGDDVFFPVYGKFQLIKRITRIA